MKIKKLIREIVRLDKKINSDRRSASSIELLNYLEKTETNYSKIKEYNERINANVDIQHKLKLKLASKAVKAYTGYKLRK